MIVVSGSQRERSPARPREREREREKKIEANRKGWGYRGIRSKRGRENDIKVFIAD